MATQTAPRTAVRHVRRAVAVIVLLAIAALALPPFINVGRYKGRVMDSVSKAFGRPVTCDSIELRLLPQPGFSLTNVTIGDDPAYSLEPMLHADELVAYLGASSLWRGRMDIARVNLNYPSLNLIERADGSWNFESLLWKTSRTQAAPTAAKRSASRLRFPYIEASNGRINFKYGLEKSVFSFTDADFKLWSPAENQWRMRLDAQPVRTDMPVTDTGRIKAEANIQRATMLRDAPIQATFSWQGVQLGNLTRLISGEDGGWRGTLNASAQFSGTASALRFSTAASLRDLRRFDITTEDEANLNVTCHGEWNVAGNTVQNTGCSLPLEGGNLGVQGMLSGFHFPRYDISVTADNIGANALLNLARHTKRNLPEDLSGSGTVSGSLHFTRLSNSPASCTGGLQLRSVILRSAVLGKNLTIDKAVISYNAASPVESRRRKRRSKSSPSPNPGALQIESFDLPLGGPDAAKVDGTLDTERFAVHLTGPATLERLQQFARTFGIGAPKFPITGAANIDLIIGGKWAALEAPQVTGTAQLKNARTDVPGFALPIEIATARVELDGDHIALTNASASSGRVSLAGSATFSRSCTPDAPCNASFDLTTDEVNLARWNEVLNPRLRKNPWYLFGGGEATGTVFANLHATGHLSAHRLNLDPVSGSAFETNFTYAEKLLQLENTRAKLLGGAISGAWKVDFTGNAPKVESTGAVEHIQAEKLAPLLKASLGSGTVNLRYALETRGWDGPSLAHSSAGEAAFTWTGGALRISPETPTPWRVVSGRGRAVLNSKGWTISDSEWKMAGGVYRLAGTVSRDSALDLQFTHQEAVWRVGGTLARPQLAASPTTTETSIR